MIAWTVDSRPGTGWLRLALLFGTAVLGTPIPVLSQCPDGTPPPCRGARAAPGPAPTSVAVLYFDNLSRDTSDTYLAEGLTDELITRLGEVARLQVKSRSAVRRFRGTADDPAAIGRALSVAHLVNGSVRRTGERVRIAVELTRAATGAHVWGETYERTDSDLMAVEAEVASAIATAVGVQLAPAERRSLAARPTVNPAAYDQLLRGDFLLARRTAADAARALAAYETAVRLDPGFSRAWARIGFTWFLHVDWGWPGPGLSRDSMVARGFAAADRSLALDSAGADGWVARGRLLTIRSPFVWTDAEAALRRAVALDPRNAEAWHQLASVLIKQMDPEGAAAYHRALALDPQRMISLANLGQYLYYQGRDTAALTMLDSALAVAPGTVTVLATRAGVRRHHGDLAGARADVDAAQRARPAGDLTFSEAEAIGLLAAEGDSASARRRAAELARWAETQRGNMNALMEVVIASALLGDRNTTIQWLERVRADGIVVWYALHDPAFAAMAPDPRFQRLLDELKPRR